MENIYSYLVAPFWDYEFMQKSLIALLCLCLSSPVVGVFLVLRRMSLSGDAISHAILPGAAIGFLLCGLSVTAMTIGGIIAGIVVIVFSSLLSNVSRSTEDGVLAVFYLLSLAAGVLIISISGSNVDLLHFLFGSILTVSNDTVAMLGIISCLSLLILTIIMRPLIIDCVDPHYLRSVSRSSRLVHLLFMTTTVLNLVAGFQAIGTLMSVGMMIMQAVAAMFWSRRLSSIIAISICAAVISSALGLIISFNSNIPSSPTIILTLGVWYLISFFLGTDHGLVRRLVKTSHFER